MKMTSKGLLFLSIVAAILVNSCEDNACNDPIAFNYDPKGTSDETCIYKPVEVNVEAIPMWDTIAYSKEQSYTMENGDAITISYFGMYLSELSFTQLGESERWTNDVMLIKNDQYTHTGLFIPEEESISKLTCTVGVNDSIYDEDPTDPTKVPETSPLAPQDPTMYWGWADGYRYISINGQVDTSSGQSGTMHDFEIHVGLRQYLRYLEFDSLNLMVEDDQINVGLVIDLSKLFTGIDLQNDGLVTHTTDNLGLATKVCRQCSPCDYG